VCNWVDALADVIWAAYAPSEWPARLVLDAGEFRTSHTLPNGGRSSRTHRAFFILAAVGYAPGDSRPRVWAMQAHGRENQSTWASLLGEFDGTPELIVTDGGQRAINAVGAVFPRPGDQAPELRRCEWHLGKNARDTLPAHIAKDPDHKLMRALRVAFWSPDYWRRFEDLTDDHAGRTGGLKGLHKWVTTNSSAISAHVATRPPLGPHSVGAVEERLPEVGRRIGDRAGAFGNQTRTNRLLRLMTLEMNGQADELAWADIIRRHLLCTGGYAPSSTRTTTRRVTARSGCEELAAAAGVPVVPDPRTPPVPIGARRLVREPRQAQVRDPARVAQRRTLLRRLTDLHAQDPGQGHHPALR